MENLATLRYMKYDCMAIQGASGSAFLVHGGTKILCSVYGPRASKKAGTFNESAQLECDIRLATTAFTPRDKSTSTMNASERDLSTMILSSLENTIRLDKYMKTTIYISFVVLEANGDILADAISCASMALANASIEMIDIVSASCVALIDKSIVIDPTTEQLATATGSVTVASMNATGDNVTQLWFRGDIPLADLAPMVEICNSVNSQVRQILRDFLISKYR
jgi:exosome complex component MTR3